MGSFRPVDRRPLLHAVLVTHRRPRALATHLERLLAQERRPDRLLVVDNADMAEVRDLVASAGREGLDATWVPTGENLGPAGGIALGMSRVLSDGAADDDWLVLLDDDDPPAGPGALAELLGFADTTRAAHPRLGGVGLTGARFDARAGRITRLPDHLLVGTVAVDYLGGNQLPTYLVGAVRDTGVFDERLFFGFDDLEFGLRMRRRGWELAVDGSAWYERRRAAGRSGPGVGTASVTARQPPWRSYYSTRNLLHLLRSQGHSAAAARVAATRVLPKAVIGAVRGVPGGREHLRLALAATRDGWSGTLGRRVEPVAKAGVTCAPGRSRPGG